MANDRYIPAPAGAAVVTFTVKVNGSVIPKTVNVYSIDTFIEIDRIAGAKIVIFDGDPANEDFPVSSEELFIPGNEIEIHAGYSTEEELVFKGVIIKHGITVQKNGSSLLKIDCRSVLTKLTIGGKSRYFSEKKDSELISEILDENKIEYDLQETEVTHEGMVQFDACDWDFIISRAEANGLLVTEEDGKLKTFKPDFSTDPVLELSYGSSIIDFDAEIDARTQIPTVNTRSWDYASLERLEVEAAEPDIEEPGNISCEELAKALGVESYTLQHGGQLTEQELQTWADGYFQKIRISKIRGKVKFQGYSQIKPGDLIGLSGLGERFNGKAFVSGVRHQIAEGVWTTVAQFGLASDRLVEKFPVNTLNASGLLPAIKGLQVGIVTQIHDDPAGEYRILVKLPIINPDEEGTWARVIAPDAGDSRGFFFRPDIGDEVLVGFINDDPRHAVILGMLHSSAKPAPLEATEDNYEKVIVTGGELKIYFEDDKKIIKLETPGGNIISLSEEDEGITLEDQNGNKVVLNADGITLDSAKDIILKAAGDVKTEGVNIENKASANYKSEGSAGAEIKSSATLTIQGSLVQIN